MDLSGQPRVLTNGNNCPRFMLQTSYVLLGFEHWSEAFSIHVHDGRNKDR